MFGFHCFRLSMLSIEIWSRRELLNDKEHHLIDYSGADWMKSGLCFKSEYKNLSFLKCDSITYAEKEMSVPQGPKSKSAPNIQLSIYLFSQNHINGSRGTRHIYIYTCTNSLDEQSWIILLVENRSHKF